MAREVADFDDPQSPDFAHWNALVGAAPPEAVQDAMAHAARRVDAREYYAYITPQVATTTGAQATRAATQAGLVSTIVVGSVSFIIGIFLIFLGLTIVTSKV